MKLVGLSGYVPASDSLLAEWKCPEGSSGVLTRLTFNESNVQNFFVIRFDWKKKDGSVESLIDGEEVEIGGVASSPPMWTGGIDASSFSKILSGGIDWYVEPDDVISLRVLNLTGTFQMFSMGFSIEDRSISNDGRWWADDDGKLVRALTFVERGLRVGDRVGGLVVVDPATYEGFDAQ